jgi:CheY-like chemotaxis protein
MSAATVLISNEDPALARTLARWVHRRGLRPVWDYEGKTVEVAKRERPALILLDVQQSNHDGRDILARLKSNPATAAIEVVVMSARTEAWVRNECLALGALEYVEKPFPERFMEVLVRLVNASDPKTAINELAEVTPG